MFERFTRQARDVVIGAVDAAREVRAAQLDTRHLLVALARDAGPAGDALRRVGMTAERLLPELGRPAPRDGLDPAALRAIGIDYEEVRRAVESEFGAGALERALGRGRGRLSGRRSGGSPRFAREAKRALEQTLREAVGLGDRHIGAEHVLLGVLHDPSSVAGRLLGRHGVDVAALRRSVVDGRERRAS